MNGRDEQRPWIEIRHSELVARDLAQFREEGPSPLEEALAGRKTAGMLPWTLEDDGSEVQARQ